MCLLLRWAQSCFLDPHPFQSVESKECKQRGCMPLVGKPVPSKAHAALFPPHSDLGDTSQTLLWASSITSWEEPWSANQNLFAVSNGLWSKKAIPFIILTCRFLGLCLMVARFIHSSRTSTGTYRIDVRCVWMHGSCVIFYILAWKVSGKNTNYDVMNNLGITFLLLNIFDGIFWCLS